MLHHVLYASASLTSLGIRLLALWVSECTWVELWDNGVFASSLLFACLASKLCLVVFQAIGVAALLCGQQSSFLWDLWLAQWVWLNVGLCLLSVWWGVWVVEDSSWREFCYRVESWWVLVLVFFVHVIIDHESRCFPFLVSLDSSLILAFPGWLMGVEDWAFSFLHFVFDATIVKAWHSYRQKWIFFLFVSLI